MPDMKSHRKLLLAASLPLLTAIAILLWPSDTRPHDLQHPPDSTHSSRRSTRPAPASPGPQARSFQNLVRKVANGEYPELSRQQIDIYLQTRHRSTGSLLAAYRLSKDEAFFREALEKSPDDPEVLVTWLALPNTPEKRLEILATLKRVDPDNSIANCLSARILLDLGNNDGALAELSETFGKTMRDYNLIAIQNVEEAYLSSGYSAVGAKLAAITQATKPLLMQMRNVADGLQKQRSAAEVAGDGEGVRTSQEIQMEMARQLRNGSFLVDALVATNLEKKVLREIDTPDAHARIEELDREVKSMRDQAEKISPLMADSSIPESDWLLYFDRVRLFGEKAANDWFFETHPQL